MNTTELATHLSLRRKSRKNFRDFVLFIMPEYKTNKFFEEMCTTINNIIDNYEKFPDSPKRILFEAAPRIGKTLLVSQMLPCYFLGRFPNKKVISCSFGDELLKSNARAVKRILQNEKYHALFGDPFSEKIEDTTLHFDVFQGRYDCFTVGGTIIGSGCNLLIVDDPSKGSLMTSSKKMNDTLEDWFYNDALTRIEMPYLVVLMHQRFGVSDLAGRVLEKDKTENKWIRKTFKAIQDDGTSICEERLPISELLYKKNTMSNFEAMYQQNPVKKGGNIIKTEYFQRYDILPLNPQKKYIVCDTAMKSGQHNDFSVISVWNYYKNGDYYLENIVRGKWDSPILLEKIRDAWNKYNPNALFIEDKASGTGLIQFLRKERIPVIELKAVKDKYLRLQDVYPKIVSQFVYIPKNASWVQDFLLECEEFTDNDSHCNDDQTDILSYALSDQCIPRRTGLNISTDILDHMQF